MVLEDVADHEHAPRRAASVHSSSASATVRASGFSTNTSLPAVERLARQMRSASPPVRRWQPRRPRGRRGSRPGAGRARGDDRPRRPRGWRRCRTRRRARPARQNARTTFRPQYPHPTTATVLMGVLRRTRRQQNLGRRQGPPEAGGRGITRKLVASTNEYTRSSWRRSQSHAAASCSSVTAWTTKRASPTSISTRSRKLTALSWLSLRRKKVHDSPSTRLVVRTCSPRPSNPIARTAES